MKPRIVILGGAGAMGRITARDLLRSSRDSVRIVVADREAALAGASVAHLRSTASGPLRGSSNAGLVEGGDSALGRITQRVRINSDVPEGLDAGGRTRRTPSRNASPTSSPGIRETDVVEMVAVDVSDPSSLRRALDGAYAVIASLPYRFNLVAMKGALEAGAHYIDLGGLFHMTRRQLDMAAEYEHAGRMAILGMGSAPGIVNVLAVLAARDLDVVREVHCLVGSVDRTRFKSAPPLGFGYSVDTLLDEFALPSAVFRNGAFATVPPLDPRERLVIRFPSPVGRLPVDTTLHSEVATLPLHFAARGIREVTFRQGFDPEFMEKLAFLVKLGLADTDEIRIGGAPSGHRAARSESGETGAGERRSSDQSVKAGAEFLRFQESSRANEARLRNASAAVDIEHPLPSSLVRQTSHQMEAPPLGASVTAVSPRQVLHALLGRLPPAVPLGRPARYEVLRALVLGRKGRRMVCVTADCHAGPRSGGGIGPDVDTGAPPSIVVQLMLAGTIEIRPGVWAPEQVVPVEPFIRELERRGMRVTRRVGRSSRCT